jgi:hypothetical protein
LVAYTTQVLATDESVVDSLSPAIEHPSLLVEKLTAPVPKLVVLVLRVKLDGNFCVSTVFEMNNLN